MFFIRQNKTTLGNFKIIRLISINNYEILTNEHI